MTPILAELAIEARSTDEAAGAQFVELLAAVSCRAFAGGTRFTIARRDLAAYSNEVSAFADGSADSAQLVGGWDAAHERLRIRAVRAGSTGLVAVAIRVADTGARADQWHRVETQFVCTMAALSEFSEALARLDPPNVVSLTGDAGSTT